MNANVANVAAVFLIAMFLPRIASATDNPDDLSTLSRWVYPNAVLVSKGGTEDPGTGRIVTEVGHFTVNADLQKIASFYAEKAGIRSDDRTLQFSLSDPTPARQGAILAVAPPARGNLAESAILMRAIEDTYGVITIFYWRGHNGPSVVVTASQAEDGAAHIQIIVRNGK